MRVGFPRGLLFDELNPFFRRFFTELGAEMVVSPETNRTILDEGIKYCVDEACLPVKVFHGHAACLRKECDIMLVPRVMRLARGEYICPKFCGLPEMVKNDIPDMPELIDETFSGNSGREITNWAIKAGSRVTTSRRRIIKALEAALPERIRRSPGFSDEGRALSIALIGHPYNICDEFINMGIVRKLHALGAGIVTGDSVDGARIDDEARELYKRPFWTFARKNYGFAVHIAKTGNADGIIYLSSFACGIDSVVVELILDRIGDFPFLLVKLDEHTGEAGLETRLEAFVELLERRRAR